MMTVRCPDCGETVPMPEGAEGALEELADRDEGDAHDLAADVFVLGAGRDPL